MAHWIDWHGHALMPQAQELQKLLLQRSVLHADETPIKQLTQKNKTIVEDAKTAYLWAYCTSDIDSQGPPIILFDFHHATQSPIAKTALDFFACWYQIEGQAKEGSVQERTEIRQKHAVPVLEAMKKWLDEQALVVNRQNYSTR